MENTTSHGEHHRSKNTRNYLSPAALTQFAEITALDQLINPSSEEITVVRAEAGRQVEQTLTYEAASEIFLKELMSQRKLSGTDALLLYNLFKENPEDQRLWDFAEKVAPRPVDFELFQKNFHLLSPEFIQALLAIGSLEERRINPETAQEKSIYLVHISKLTQGGIGMITNSFFCEDQDMDLKPVLVKTALASREAQFTFSDEIEMAKKIKTLIEQHPNDPRTKHILKPLYIGKNFLVMPIIQDKQGSSKSLGQLDQVKPESTANWAKQIIGAMEGNAFLVEHGLINVDFKAANVMTTENGGILIDWGGFMEKYQLKKGSAEIRGKASDLTMYPFLNNKIAALVPLDEAWEKNSGNLPHTPGYANKHLLAMEMLEQVPAGTLHKFILYRIIARYFLNRFQITGEPEFAKLSELDKLYYPAIELPQEQLSPADQLLYKLYLKLHQSHFHPYHFLDDDLKKGMDPDYISNMEIHSTLEKIAKLK